MNNCTLRIKKIGGSNLQEEIKEKLVVCDIGQPPVTGIPINSRTAFYYIIYFLSFLSFLSNMSRMQYRIQHIKHHLIHMHFNCILLIFCVHIGNRKYLNRHITFGDISQ